MDPALGNDSGNQIINISIDAQGSVTTTRAPVPILHRRTLGDHYGGNFLEAVHSLQPGQRLETSRKLLHIVHTLHENGTVHGSICASNVTLRCDGSISLRNANLYPSIQRWLNYVPVFPCARYRPRDVLLSDDYTPSRSCDIYALSVLVYSAFAGEEPYANHGLCACVSAIGRFGHLELVMPNSMPLSVWNVLTNVWSAMPDKRPTTLQL